MDVYRGDFEAERTAKESIKSEKDQLSEDMQHLQRRNQQLQEEIEVLREKNFEYCPSNLTQNTGTTSRERSSNNSVSLKSNIKYVSIWLLVICMLISFFYSHRH